MLKFYILVLSVLLIGVSATLAAWDQGSPHGGGAGVGGSGTAVGGGFPVTLESWYNLDLQDPSAAARVPWDDGSGNIIYSRVLGSTNSVNLYVDFRVATGSVVTITSPLAWETGTNVAADVICDIKYAYGNTTLASVTNTTAALPPLATATQGEETICTWTNTVGTAIYRFWFDKADSDVAYGELGFMGSPTITIEVGP